MQQINSTLQYSETALSQRGTADVARTPAGRTYETFRFPYTPQERERKITTAKTQRTPESIRNEQIDSAVENALSQYKQNQQQEQQLTPEQIQAWAQWFMSAAQTLEVMRETEMGSRSDHGLVA